MWGNSYPYPTPSGQQTTLPLGNEFYPTGPYYGPKAPSILSQICCGVGITLGILVLVGVAVFLGLYLKPKSGETLIAFTLWD